MFLSSDTGEAEILQTTINEYRDACCVVEGSEVSCGGLPIFTYHDDLKTWQEAKTACEERGANLASIHSAYENTLVDRLIESQTDPE